MRCRVTCTFTTLQAISYVIMHFKCFIVACFVLSRRLLFTTLVCPTHSSHYRTNVLFTMSRIIFCHYVACSWFALDILWLPFFTWSLVGACIAQLSYAIVECLGYLCLLDVFPFQFTIAMGSMKARQKPRNTPTKFEGITKFLIFVGVVHYITPTKIKNIDTLKLSGCVPWYLAGFHWAHGDCKLKRKRV